MTKRHPILCKNCILPKPPDDYLFPLIMRGKSTYCRCIEWETLYNCLALSVVNAKRLLGDADLLLKSAGPELYEWYEKIGIDTKTPDDAEALKFAKNIDYSRLITSLSILILALQEVGKAGIALDHIEKKEDIQYDRDYRKKLLLHGDRIEAAAELMKKLGRWPPYFEERKANLEILRQKSLYVDYDFNFGIWIEPTALGSPEEVGYIYSGAIFSGLLELLSGQGNWKSSDGLTDLMVGGERFNTFSFSKILSKTLSDTLESLSKIVAQMHSDPKRKGEIKRIRFAKYIDVSNLPAKDREKALLERLTKITDLLAPQIAKIVNRESREHFEQREQERNREQAQ